MLHKETRTETFKMAGESANISTPKQEKQMSIGGFMEQPRTEIQQRQTVSIRQSKVISEGPEKAR